MNQQPIFPQTGPRVPSVSDQETHRLPDDLWVVVAAYNEASRLGSVLEELMPVVASVVVVNDGSRDDTSAQALEYPVWLVEHPVNLGQGAALQTGIDFALSRGAEYVATFDADGQHMASDLRLLYDALRLKGVDVALGSRFLGRAEGIPLLRRWMLRAAVVFTGLLSGLFLTDAHNGLRLFTRRAAGRLRITMNRMEHASEVIEQIAAAGLTYTEVPVTIRYTAASLAKGQGTLAAGRLGFNLLVEKLVR